VSHFAALQLANGLYLRCHNGVVLFVTKNKCHKQEILSKEVCKKNLYKMNLSSIMDIQNSGNYYIVDSESVTFPIPDNREFN